MEKHIQERYDAAKAMKLPEDVSKDFELVGLAGAGKVVTNKLTGQLIDVNLSKISVTDARTLVKNGFKNLRAKNKAALADIPDSAGAKSDDKGKSGKG